MKLIVVTAPEEVVQEAELLVRLFEAGLEILHLRKPDWSEATVEAFLRKLPPRYYRKIVLHAHYRLIEKYNLKGIHLPEYYRRQADPVQLKSIVRTALRRGLTVSTSIHTLEDLQQNKQTFSYVLLSPVFESISKQGYAAAWSTSELQKALLHKERLPEVIALGGINAANVQEVRAMGFAGVALLGAVWSEGDAVENFREIKAQVNL